MIDLELIEELNSNKNSLYTDFTAETIASYLIKNGIDPEKIFIVPNGNVGKSSAKEVEAIRIIRSIFTLNDFVYIIANRAGIYDTLPEGLFHKEYGYNEPDPTAKIKLADKEEKDARQFFLLFEIVLNRYKLAINDRENVGTYECISPIINLFTKNWPIFKLLDERQAVLFFYAIPILHRIRNDYNLASDFLSRLFGAPITITLKHKTITQRVYPESSLSVSGFGGSSVLGGISSEVIPVIEIGIGPLEDETLSLFIPTSPNDRLLDEVFLWLFDCQLTIEKNIIAINKPDERPAAYYLGVNSFF